ncbi:unnamed protein product, partial [Polarella glacialis]
ATAELLSVSTFTGLDAEVPLPAHQAGPLGRSPQRPSSAHSTRSGASSAVGQRRHPAVPLLPLPLSAEGAQPRRLKATSSVPQLAAARAQGLPSSNSASAGTRPARSSSTGRLAPSPWDKKTAPRWNGGGPGETPPPQAAAPERK